MLWSEGDDERYQVPDDVVDLVFRLQGERLQVDHAQLLDAALGEALAWWREAEGVGAWFNLGVEEGNGWYRHEAQEPLYLSRRARLILRLPKALVIPARALSAERLHLGDHALMVGPSEARPLSDHRTLYARHVVSDGVEEEAFLRQAAPVLADMGVTCRKAVCGRERRLSVADGVQQTRSLLLAELRIEDFWRET